MTRARFYAIGFTVLMLFDTWTQISFKLASRQTGAFNTTMAWLRAAAESPWIYGAIAGYVGAFIAWMTLLKRAPVGPAFAASHMEVVVVLVLSVFLFGEHMTQWQIAGAASIVAGIVFLSISESKHADA